MQGRGPPHQGGFGGPGGGPMGMPGGMQMGQQQGLNFPAPPGMPPVVPQGFGMNRGGPGPGPNPTHGQQGNPMMHQHQQRPGGMQQQQPPGMIPQMKQPHMMSAGGPGMPNIGMPGGVQHQMMGQGMMGMQPGLQQGPNMPSMQQQQQGQQGPGQLPLPHPMPMPGGNPMQMQMPLPLPPAQGNRPGGMAPQQQQSLPLPHPKQLGMVGGGIGRPPFPGQNVSALAALQAARGGTGYKAPGTQSAAPNAKEVKNDYCQQFVDTGARPQNYLRDSHLTDRYEEYPKMKELIRMKDQMVADNTTPAYFLKADLRSLKLSTETFGTKFDVILIDPPWEEYVRRAPHAAGLKDREVWNWQDIQALEIENIADNPSFCFLWCGTAEGLDAGRHCLTKWGFRRVEDIVWIKSNKDRNPRTGYLQAVNQEPFSVLTHTKEHCLMGLKGSVRRNMDGHFIHANVDTDVIVSEEPAAGSTEKPAEMYEIIERFCLAKRRLELFGEEHNIRDGWVTVGRQLPTSNFRPEVYASHFRGPDGRLYVENATGGRVPRNSPILIPVPPEVEESRPKSPPNERGRGR